MRKFILVLISLLTANISAADDYADTIKAHGPAEDKIEKETKRVEEWGYPGLSVVFRNGSLNSEALEPPPVPTLPTTGGLPAPAISQAPSPAKRAISAETLSDILNSLPSDDSQDASGPAPRMPGRPFIPN